MNTKVISEIRIGFLLLVFSVYTKISEWFSCLSSFSLFAHYAYSILLYFYIKTYPGATTTALSPQSCTTGSPTMLLNLLNPGLFSYIYYSYSYTPTTYQATIMVELQQDPSSIYIDAISITNTTGGELLTNGGFETGGLPPWQRGTVSGGSISSGCGYSGTYCYADGIVGQTDNIHQTFLTVPGSNTTVSFYLQNNAAGSTIIARVCIYPY